MKRKVVAAFALILVAGITAGVGWYARTHPEGWGRLQDELQHMTTRMGWRLEEEQDKLVVSGFIEADEASVRSEVGGRIVHLGADEGDEVKEGQIVVRLDDSLLQAKIKKAEAELALAEANLAQIKAGARPETVAHAQAVLHQAEAARDAARVAWEDAQAMQKNPQDLELTILAAQNQLEVLSLQQLQAEAIAHSAQAARDLADETVRLLEEFEPRTKWVLAGSYSFDNLPPDIPLPPGAKDGEYRIKGYKVVIENGTISLYVRAAFKVPTDLLNRARYEQATATYRSWLAWSGLTQAQTAQSGASDYLAELRRQKANPLTLKAQADAAQAQYAIASSAVEVAQAQVESLKMGATPEQIAVVQAQVEAARAALQTLHAQSQKMQLRAPISGWVLDRPVHAGEVAVPGAPLMTIADLDQLSLTVYVPEDWLGWIQIGQSVPVTVDAYPNRIFTGTVVAISNRAEFTPKNVQTRQERVNMVFAVEIRLANPDHALKPGMPADAVLRKTSEP